MDNPKEKAKELKAKFLEHFYGFGISPDTREEKAIRCALIHCDGIIKALDYHFREFDKLKMFGSSNPILHEINNWEKIKAELKKLT